MIQRDQKEFYTTCPLCGLRIGNNIYGVVEHKCQEVESIKAVQSYVSQMAEAHAFKIDQQFWLVVKQKPKWLPSFLYKAVVKNLVELQYHKDK